MTRSKNSRPRVKKIYHSKAPYEFRQAPKSTIWYFSGDLSSWLGPIVTNRNFSIEEVALATVIGKKFHYNPRARTNLIEINKKDIIETIRSDKYLKKSGFKIKPSMITSITEKLVAEGHIAKCCHARNLYYFTDPTK